MIKKLNNEKVVMDDVCLLSLIRNYWIYNFFFKQYKFYDYRIDYFFGQLFFVDSLLNNKVYIYYRCNCVL